MEYPQRSTYRSLLIVLVLSFVHIPASGRIRKICEPVVLPICMELGQYNETLAPNLSNYEAYTKILVDLLLRLGKRGCSPYMNLLICSVYEPPCNMLSEDNWPIPPCRPICEEVRAGCEHTLRKYGFGWPYRLECEIFPNSPREGPCFEFGMENFTYWATPPMYDVTTLAAAPTDVPDSENTPRYDGGPIPTLDSEIDEKICDCQCECTSQP